jgi:hypothetical protein
VGWAERWEKAKENHARFVLLRLRGRLFMIGAVLALASGGYLYSETRHVIHGSATTVTVLEHIDECTVEYQRVGEERRKEKMACGAAEEFQRRVGSNKVRVSHAFIARVRFPLADGGTREARVDESRLGSFSLPVGATLPAIYSRDDPADVRAPLSWERIQGPLIMLTICLAFFAPMLIRPFAVLLGWALRGRMSAADEQTAWAPSEHAEWGRNAPVTGNRGSLPAGSTPRPSFGLRNR